MAEENRQTQVYSRSGDVIEAAISDGVVLLDTKGWNYFEFDEIGSSIWALLSEPKDMSALVDSLVMKFDADRDVCLSDTKAFLNDLIAQGLVTVRNGA